MMRTRTFTLVAAGAIGVVSAVGQPPPKVDPPADQVRTIPLESCYTTRGISGGKFIQHGGNEPYAFFLGELVRDNHSGASNVALVCGQDIAGAVKATRWTFAAGWGADTPVTPNINMSDNKTERFPFWLAAYFGKSTSSPGFGRIVSAEVRGQTVRLVYARVVRRPGSASTSDVVPCYAWIPLGQLGSGTCVLELFDADRNEVTLLRRVTVTQP